jgi:tetratricopeptide (TPR) repeat protein
MRTIIVSALLSAAILAGGAPQQARAAEELFDTKAASELIEKGINHLISKNYDAAIKAFEESASVSPDAEPYYYLGYAYYMKAKKTNNPESRKKSMENFAKAFELNPNFTPSRFKPEATPAEAEAKQKKVEPAEPDAPMITTETPGQPQEQPQEQQPQQ